MFNRRERARKTIWPILNLWVGMTSTADNQPPPTYPIWMAAIRKFVGMQRGRRVDAPYRSDWRLNLDYRFFEPKEKAPLLAGLCCPINLGQISGPRIEGQFKTECLLPSSAFAPLQSFGDTGGVCFLFCKRLQGPHMFSVQVRRFDLVDI